MLQIKIDDLVQALADRLTKSTSTPDETADPMARACIFNSIEQMFTDFATHISSFRSVAAKEYQSSKDFDLVTKGINRHANNFNHCMASLTGCIIEELRGGAGIGNFAVPVPTQNPQGSRSRGNSNFMESNYGSVLGAERRQSDLMVQPINVFDEARYGSGPLKNTTSFSAGGPIDFVSGFMDEDVSPREKNSMLLS